MRLAALVLISAALAPLPALADTRDDVSAGIYRCARIADDRQWLECLYGAAQPMRAKLGLPPAPESQQAMSRLNGPVNPPPMAMAPPLAMAQPVPSVSAAPLGRPNLVPSAAAAPPPPPSADFGLPHDSTKGTETSRITAFKFDQFGTFTVTLANGQVWKQSDSDSLKATWHTSPDKMTYSVTISEGILGSYNFKVSGMPGNYKVKRIK